MRTLRLTLLLVAITAMAAPWSSVNAQIVTGSANGRHSGPFIEPDTFRPDFQFFAPADVSDYDPHPEAPTGFFFTYDRVYINVTRPESAEIAVPSEVAFLPGGVILQPNLNVFVSEPSSNFDGDFTWGNRLEFGFVNDDDHGWDIVGWHIDGPNQNNYVEQGDRLDVVERNIPGTQEVTDADDNTVITYATDSISTAPLSTDALVVGQSVNNADFSSIELNKILKRHYFHAGGVFEPMIGVRYMRFNDQWRNRRYTRFDSDSGGVDDSEIYTDNRTWNENNMLGGQLGFRLFKETGHWKLSSEVRMFASQNWQITNSTLDEYWWLGVPGARSPTAAFERRYAANTDNSELVWGGELKMEAEYKITRDLAIRTGFVFIDLGQGISRGQALQTRDQLGNMVITQSANDQDVQMFGMTIGVDMRR